MRRGFDPHDAEDIVQHVFIVAALKGGYLPGPALPRSWLCAIALRLSANAYRRRKTLQRFLTQEDVEAQASHDLAPDTLFAKQEHAERAARAFAMLSADQQTVLLRFLSGESCADIAQSEKVPVGTVYSRMHGARAKLLQAYGSMP